MYGIAYGRPKRHRYARSRRNRRAGLPRMLAALLLGFSAENRSPDGGGRTQIEPNCGTTQEIQSLANELRDRLATLAMANAGVGDCRHAEVRS